MNIINIFKDSLSFPVKQWKKWLIFGVLLTLISIFEVLESFGIIASLYLIPTVDLILSLVIVIVFGFITAGYKLNVIKDTINNLNEMPSFEFGKNFVSGFKVFILNIVYYIIPAIIIFVTAYFTNIFNYLYFIYSHYRNYGAITSATSILSTSADINILIFLIVSLISLVIFKILLLIATAVLAQTNNLSSALNIKNVVVKISKIGWKNYIIWLVIYLIAFIIIDLIIQLVYIIPIFWAIIIPLFISSYFAIFTSKAIGLLYSSANS
ncbi:MAG: DUF4013 domain-containing protein [Methanobrevibacter sp.]|jgi:hypothetical protein|nr:DUF4013 domain-containing protein [Candidatus Methanoflexus mossambicus]